MTPAKFTPTKLLLVTAASCTSNHLMEVLVED